MIIPFQNQPSTARIWLYQANRTLTIAEMAFIEKYLLEPITQWAAHGAGLQASFQIFENRVVAIALNENVNEASGCSIDASTRWFKDLGQILNIDFFDRNLCYLDKEWKSVLVFGIKKAVENGQIDVNTKIIDTTITAKGQIEQELITEAGQSWLQKYFIHHG